MKKNYLWLLDGIRPLFPAMAICGAVIFTTGCTDSLVKDNPVTPQEEGKVSEIIKDPISASLKNFVFLLFAT